jgi:5-methylcytosine-specific restriction endonuclease McrA
MKVYGPKRCQVCGQEYQPASPTQKYCPECAPGMKKVSCAKYRKENLEKCKASAKASSARWKKENPEKVKAGGVKYREANLEKCKANITKWFKTNPEKARAKIRKWQKANPEKVAVSGSKRRTAKYASTPISEMLTSTEWLAILAEADGHCAYCGKEAKLTLDHVIPLSKGGRHSKDNVVPACGHCNSSKKDKTLEEWNKVTRSQLEAARG